MPHPASRRSVRVAGTKPIGRGDTGGLMDIRRNEASFGAGGFRGIGGPDQGVRRRRGRLPHWFREFRNEANFGGRRCRGGSYGSGGLREIGARSEERRGRGRV